MSNATSIEIPIINARRLATAGTAAYKTKLKGLPPALDEETLQDYAHVAQKGIDRSQIMATEDQRKKAFAILGEENMRRGLVSCVERAERLADFFEYADKNSVFPGESRVAITFDDFVFLAYANEVKDSDFK